jgi:sugar phosphate isomerase/epimerase
LTAKVGASIYVAHLNSLPMITNPRYLDGFVPRLVEFWWPFADRAAAHGITIVLENLWEAGPELHKKVVSEAGHPALKASFDNGHGLVFSQASASEWIAELGPDLAHCHLHDNRGDRDDHLVIGAGIEDWPALLDALGEHAPGALVILENDSLSLNLESLKQLRRMMDAE